jgi:hypothetical protein
MSLTALQRNVCVALAGQRKRSGESYVAGGGALNEVVGGARRSRDVDLFHDTAAALVATWPQDRQALQAAGFLEVSARWHQAVAEARQLVAGLPAEHGGTCVVDRLGRLATAPPASLAEELAAGRIAFRQGSIRGAFPELRIHPTAP